MDSFYNLIHRFARKKTFTSDQDLCYYIILSGFALFAGIIHLVLLTIYFFIGADVMVLINLASVSVYVICFAIIRRKYHRAIGLIISLEIIAYSMASTIICGNDSYTFLYLFSVLILQMMVKYTGKGIRTFISVFILVCLLVSPFINRFIEPIVSLGAYNLLIQILNITLTYFIIIPLLIINNIFNNIVSHINFKKLHELEGQANTDPLTELYNRRFAEIAFDSIRKRKADSKLCVAMVDIDDFKAINDEFGHEIGDVILKRLARIVTKSLRKTDLVFRWGGEEFLIILDGVDTMTAYTILDKLRENIASTPIISADSDLRITVTIGISKLETNNIYGSISNSDRNMYKGKAIGKNICVI